MMPCGVLNAGAGPVGKQELPENSLGAGYPHGPAQLALTPPVLHTPNTPPTLRRLPTLPSPACFAAPYLVFSGVRSAQTAPLASCAARTSHPRSWWAGRDSRLQTLCGKRQAVTGSYERAENHIQNTLSLSLGDTLDEDLGLDLRTEHCLLLPQDTQRPTYSA